MENELDFTTNDSDINEAKVIVDSLYNGPGYGGGYLAWTGDLLQEAEFKLARYAERISEKEAKADSLHNAYYDEYKRQLAIEKQNVRNEFLRSKEKFTRDEVDDEASIRVAGIQKKAAHYYAEFKQLRGAVASIQRYLLSLTHRINELQSEKRYPQ